MNVLSLFDGISCARVALERAGHKVDRYFASEIDKYAIKIAMKNYPDTVQLGDVKNIHMTNFGIEVDLPQSTMRTYGSIPDLIVGGSPCQGFSVAGKGLNFSDPRSALFFEFVRIVKECQVLNPNVKFMLENVDMKREWRKIITEHLGVQPIFIDSKVLSAQQRQRWYWCSFIPKDKYFDVCHPKDRGIVLNDILQDESEVNEKYYLSDKALSRIKIRNYSDAKINPEKTGNINTRNNSAALSTDSGTTLIQRGRGKNKGGEHADKSTTVTSNRWEQNNFIQTGGVIDHLLFKANKANKANNIDANYFKGQDNHGARTVVQVNEVNEFGTQPHQQNRVYDTDGKSPAHLAEMSSGTHAVKVHNGYGRTGGIKQGGTGPLAREDGKTYNCDTSSGTNKVEFDNGRIRRLTPIEVERLFGLPDNYTEGISDSRRYHALGNGWQVDTVEHIFKYLNL